MRLFVREEHTSDIDKIWNYLTSQGTPLFRYGLTEHLWREFSEKTASAGFLFVIEQRLEEFIDWLEDCDIEVV